MPHRSSCKNNEVREKQLNNFIKVANYSLFIYLLHQVIADICHCRSQQHNMEAGKIFLTGEVRHPPNQP